MFNSVFVSVGGRSWKWTSGGGDNNVHSHGVSHRWLLTILYLPLHYQRWLCEVSNVLCFQERTRSTSRRHWASLSSYFTLSRQRRAADSPKRCSRFYLWVIPDNFPQFQMYVDLKLRWLALLHCTRLWKASPSGRPSQSWRCWAASTACCVPRGAAVETTSCPMVNCGGS